MSVVATGSRPSTALPTRDAILDAAEARFADGGLDGVSVREIAADVGLRNQASLYHYFASKHAIYEAVLERGIAAVMGTFADLQPTSSGGFDLAGGIDRMVDYLVEHPNLARLIQRAGLEGDVFVRDTVGRIIQPLFAAGLQVLGDSGGRWDAEELPFLAAGLYHLIFGYFANATLLEAVLPADPRSDTAVTQQRRFLKRAMTQLLGVTPNQ
jgi:AcrR family transcriptional regulator